MASSSFKAKTSNDYIYGTVNWSSVLNSTNNTSDVTATLVLRKYYLAGKSTLPTSGTGTWILYINNVPYKLEASKSFNFDSDTIVISNTVTVPHNADGSKKCSIIVTGGIPNSSYTETEAEGTATLDLNTVPATILTAPNFTDLQNPTITFSNPKNYPVQFKIEDINGSVDLIATEKLVDYEEDSYTFELTEAQRNILRDASVNYEDFPVRFTVSSYIPASSTIPTYWSWLDRTMHVTAGTPTFESFDYIDSNSFTASITGNSSVFIQKYSTCKITVPVADKMIAQKDATPKGYTAWIGDKYSWKNYSDVSDVVFDQMSIDLPIDKLTVVAFDSRNKYTQVSKNITVCPYDVKKNTSKIVAFRQNGFGNTIIINFYGTYNPIFVNNVQKNVLEVTIKYTVNTEPYSWTIVTQNIYPEIAGTFNDSIQLNLTNADYKIEVSVADYFDDIGDTLEKTLYSKPILYIDDDYRIGINMVPNGVDIGLYLKDTDVFYGRFKTYFDTYWYSNLYDKVSQQMFPVGSVFTTSYPLTIEAIPIDGTWVLNYYVIYNGLTPVVYFHKRTG
jgi:hypothetical protein